jgi:hypothetical protein
LRVKFNLYIVGLLSLTLSLCVSINAFAEREAQDKFVPAPAFTKVPDFFVPAPPFSEGIFPCSAFLKAYSPARSVMQIWK